jgi:hypothetical protein
MLYATVSPTARAVTTPPDRLAATARIVTVATLTISAYVALYHASRIAVRDGRIPYEFEVTNPLEGWLLLASPDTGRIEITPPVTIALLNGTLLASVAALALVTGELVAMRRARATLTTSPRYARAHALCAALCLVAFLAAFAAL